MTLGFLMNGITDLARKGRNGDNTLMHVSQDEVAGLNALARSAMGRELTTNPETGLPEAFLFAPFLAPMVAGGLGVGGSALATGLTAGALGATEAAARGMDDPLQRGLYAGLTAGAASGIGNALSGASQAGQAATAAPGAPSLDAAVAGQQAGTLGVSNPTMPTPSSASLTPTSGQLSLTGQTAAPQMAAGPSMSTMSPGGVSSGASMQAPGGSPISGGADFSVNTPAPTTGDFSIGGSQYGDIPQMGEGLKNISNNPAARQQFMQDIKGPAAAGFVGLGGQAQMGVQDDMKARAEEKEAEKQAELKQAQDTIRSNYAAVGRPMPTGFGGGPLFEEFQEGGIVGLRRGGRLAPSRRAGRSDDRDRDMRSTNPGRPGGESGERALTMRTGRPSSHPGRPGGEANERFMTMQGGSRTTTPAGRMGERQGPGSGGIVGGVGANPETQAPAAPPPNPQYDEFMRQLQQGAGNRLASQRSGYTGGYSPAYVPPDRLNQFIEEYEGEGDKKSSAPASVPGGRGDGGGLAQGGYLDGGMLPGDGMSDGIEALIDGEQPAALSSGEFVIPADVVSHLGNGSSDAGAKQLYAMMDRIRRARTGKEEQAPEVKTEKMMPK